MMVPEALPFEQDIHELERLLDRDTTLSADFSYVRGLHLPRTRNAGKPNAKPRTPEASAPSKQDGINGQPALTVSRPAT